MEYKLKTYKKFEITGRGTCISINTDENDIKEINVGSVVILDDNTKWEVRNIEQTSNAAGIGKNIGLLIKKK